MDAQKMAQFQLQMRENQEELSDFVSGLGSWTQEMKQKEAQAKASQQNKSEPSSDPPVRNSLLKKKRKKVERPKKAESAESARRNAAGKKIGAYDYRAWDRFDVDSALANVDKEQSKEEEEEETDEEWEEERRGLLAQQEKEKGNAHFKAGRWDEAVESYSTAIRLDPTNPLLFTNRAMAQLRAERFGAAEADCTEALRLDPNSTKALYRRGLARKRLGAARAGDALTDFEAVLELEPSNKAARSEATALEKIVRPTGEVKAIHKAPGSRSKKPLRRIAIEQIGALPDQLPARQTEPELANFLQERASGASITELPPAAVPKKEEAKKEEKEEAKKEEAKEEAKEERTPRVSDPEELPPRSFGQFSRSFASLKFRGDACLLPYLARIPPSSFVGVFGQCLEPVHLNAVLRALCTLADAAHAAAGLRALWQTPRFGFLAMMIGGPERALLRDLLPQLRAAEVVTAEEGERLASDYRL